MGNVRNILFIMADQLRWDYLSCYGHPSLETPNIDSLAKRGVRFDAAYVQSPVCGPSRASFYTGRTVFSHGATWNQVPLPIGELTMGDYLRPLGMRTAVVGKTHMKPDIGGMARLGLATDTEIGVRIAEPGFDPYERDDGLHPDGLLKRRGGHLSYNDWLRKLGYDGDNPWNSWANSAEGENGEILSGWHLRNSNLPARIKEEHSETAYMTDRAIEFMIETGENPWLLHLSYIKPHWPYIAPAPYHDLYGPNSFIAPNRSQTERDNANPVFQAFMNMEVSRSFSDIKIRETVLTGYMGLIKQIDDHLGRLFTFLEKTGRMDDTLIVFTSDHGDYMGDHWLGEKELFHEESVRVPLIICDPRPEAEQTRGSVEHRFVEAIDLLPTFLDCTGTTALSEAAQRLEGISLTPLLHGLETPHWRNSVFSEIDYAFYAAREFLGVSPGDARGFMIRSDRWKYIYFKGFPPQLFDLENDPNEWVDLGQIDAFEPIRRDMKDQLFERLLERKNRTTVTDQQVLKAREGENETGIMIGIW
jgi:arylsulfatase A-like enzyme